ncbi:hypothetical protein MF672_010705 [Actinomadura sp. ATCC 31491]|uniref:Uncharacterized protein n=1 Tax=Actinomadura luzonensis TaxID=2805427 RepID=A0ABT0FPI4_9ACTN|nr:hypothetical protein [Actinomadura luzonensis]MCK2214256.1 hypothetical protein [Actinomadura luzonensis]
MSSTYSTTPAPAVPPSRGPIRARIRPHLTDIPAGPAETIEFFFDDDPDYRSYLVLPRDAAYDVVSRMQDVPPSLSLMTAEIVGHVRYVLDTAYRDEADEPPALIADLILFIAAADDEHRRRIGRGYPAHVTAVVIGTATDGLAELRHLHETLRAHGGRRVDEAG